MHRPVGRHSERNTQLAAAQDAEVDIGKMVRYLVVELQDIQALAKHKKHDIEVLLMLEPVDVFILQGIQEFDKKPLKAIDKGDINLDGESKSEDKEVDHLSKSLINLFKETLSDQVEDVKVSKRLVDSAVTLVTGEDGMDRQMERMMKLMGHDPGQSKRIMEINTEHPVIRNLSRRLLANPSDPFLKKCIVQLFESARLIDGELPSRSDYVKRMMEIMEEATK